MKKTRTAPQPMTEEKSEQIQDLMVEFFEMNEIRPMIAVSEMLKLCLKMCAISQMSVEDVEQLFKLLIIAYKNKELEN